MKRIIFLFLPVFLIMGSFYQNIAAYETTVHSAISNAAFNQSVLGSGYLSVLGISPLDKFDNMSPLQLIQLGSVNEDNSLRWLNHFYDPTTGQGLNYMMVGKPSLQWGKSDVNNEWDWTRAKGYYYLALTNTQTATRSAAFAHVFRGVGQVMHLIEDKAVPAHVRNDAHPYYFENDYQQQRDMYEKYTRDAVDPNNPQIPWLTFSGYSPVELSVFNNFDTFWINGGKGCRVYKQKFCEP